MAQAADTSPTTIRSPRAPGHALLNLGFPGPEAAAAATKKARPAEPVREAGAPTGGGPPSSSSMRGELAALRATVAELRGTVEHLREHLDVLEERTRPHKAAAKTCAPVLIAARGRVTSLGEGLGGVEERLARAAELRPRKRRTVAPVPAEATEQTAGPEARPEAPSAAAPPGPSAAFPPAAPTMQPPFRNLPLNPDMFSLDTLENARELIRDVRPIVDDMWDAARDTSEKSYGHEERRAKIDETAFRIMQCLSCAESELLSLRQAATDTPMPPAAKAAPTAAAELHVPEGARVAVERRVTMGEATPVEVIHHLVGAESDPTLVGITYTLRAQLGALDALIEVEADPWHIGHVRQFCERLADVLTSEVAKLDFEGPTKKGAA
ncbi:hypothetical protein QHF85_09160 [Polyangium sp. 6x1]|nr:hypothetical protein [Polyangium sp. 6x1]